MKEFKNIEHSELLEGIIKMLEYLDIAGSTSTYNIYNAIYAEQEKAKNFKEPEDLN
mgnify:CR=1 FL=1